MDENSDLLLEPLQSEQLPANLPPEVNCHNSGHWHFLLIYHTQNMYPSRVHTVLQTGRSSVLRHLPLILEVPVSIIPACDTENFGVRTRFL